MTTKRKFSVKNHPGVRYYEDDERKYRGRPDRYFSIRHRVNGKLKEEGIGWESNGVTAKDASEILAELKRAKRFGAGPESLAQKRERKKIEEAERQQKALINKKENITINDLWNYYFDDTKHQKKECSWKREESLYRLWISPNIGHIAAKMVLPINLELIKKSMMEAKKSPSTIRYALAVISQIYNFGRKNDFITCQSPTKSIKKPQKDNRRQRYLTKEEAKLLLDFLKNKCLHTYEMALLSLHTGIRSGEIRSLKYGDINLNDRTIHIKDAKGYKNRTVYMTDTVFNTFVSKDFDNKDLYVFKDKNNKMFKEVPKIFFKTVQALEFNKSIKDPRDKVVFHTLRHTFASWLVKKGYDIYHIQKLLGHSTITMTERYAHHQAKKLMSAKDLIEEFLND